MSASMLKTYPEFLASAAARYGERWAAERGPSFARKFAACARETAATASPEEAASFLRVADLMDPDLYEPKGGAEDAAA
ncbi:hypothetical protein ACFWNQ_25070 [Streptomyces virginiae]|uniref:hypothetical protein n=1 Tax=Streptomyces virginiae TaxID=1961 RepID=UPI003654A41A